MKKTLLAFLLPLLLATHSQAQGGAGHPFGFGIVVGDPTGITGKYWFDAISALDFSLGYDSFPHYWDGVGIQVDYLYHAYKFPVRAPFRLLFYVGPGGKIVFWDDDWDHDHTHEHGVAVGARFPFGLTMVFAAPFDVFLELAPGIMFNAPDHDVRFDLDIALGGRFYF